MSPQPATASATHSRTGAARVRPPNLVSLCCIRVVVTVIRLSPQPGAIASDLTLTDDFDLSHPKQLNSRTATLLDQAADANASVFERLKADSRSLERRHHAP